MVFDRNIDGVKTRFKTISMHFLLIVPHRITVGTRVRRPPKFRKNYNIRLHVLCANK